MLSSNTNVAVDRVLLQLSRPDSVSADLPGTIVTSEDRPVMNPRLMNPVMCRVGNLDKVNRQLVFNGHFVHATESKKAALCEFERCLKTEERGLKTEDSGKLRSMMSILSKSSDNFAEKQKARLVSADVIGVTCASANSPLLSGIMSQVLILDEVSQITEPSSLLPIASCRPSKLLLIGDPKQLPPTLSLLPAAAGASCSDISRTLFDRLVCMGYGTVSLRTQYRCHPEIAEICSQLFYEGHLLHGVSPEDRPSLIPNLPPVSVVHNPGEDTKVGDSCINCSEAVLVCELINYTQNVLVREEKNFSIGVICMYKAQAGEVIKRMASSSAGNVTISTVDAFQGSEMDIIIICTSRYIFFRFSYVIFMF